MTPTYEIRIVPSALKAIRQIPERRIRESLKSRIDRLAHEPEKQGKPLVGELAGYRSIRAAGHRSRIIYRVERIAVVVIVVTIGCRKAGSKKDIYELARKLIRLRLVEP